MSSLFFHKLAEKGLPNLKKVMIITVIFSWLVYARWTRLYHLGCIHTCLVCFDWIKLNFVSPLHADLLGRCEYSIHTQVWTKQPYRDPAEEVEWCGWMNESMNRIYGSLVKMPVWKLTTQAKINIVFGSDQSKWTCGLSWCDYTLKHGKSQIFMILSPLTKSFLKMTCIIE